MRAFASEDHELALYTSEVSKARELNERLGFGIGLFQVNSLAFIDDLLLTYR